MKRVVLSVAVLSCWVMTTEAAAQTTGYLLPCSAARQAGRGCVILPGSGDVDAMLVNPAGLARASRQRALSVSFGMFMPELQYTNSANSGGVAGEDNLYPIPAVSFATGNGNWAVGVGAQTVGGMGAEYRLTHPLLGADQLYRSKVGLMRAGVAAAYRPAPRLSIGAVGGLLYGQLEFSTPYAVSPAVLQGFAGLAQDPDYAPLLANFAEATAYADLTGLSGVALTAGFSVEYRPSEGVAVSLAYTLPATLTLGGGSAAMDMNAQFSQLYQALVAAKGGNAAIVDAQLAGFGINPGTGMATTFDAEADFGIPQTLTLSLGVRPNARWSLGADLGWIGYESAFDEFPIRLSAGSNANINILMNADSADGTFNTAWPLRWKDSWIVRAGAEYAATPALSLRAGAIYGSNPVPSQTLFTIFPAIVERAVTFGVGYELGRSTLSLSFVHSFAREQQAATPHLVAAEYAGSMNRLSENLITAGASWRF